jgi:uncharacterized protein (TIGR00255 family)
MIRSMTGFGEAERDTPLGRLRAEVRTVNHRYFSANLRLGRALDRFEPQIRDTLRTHLPRGHINFSLRLEEGSGAGRGASRVRVDEARAREYLQALRTLKTAFGLPGEVDLLMLARFNDVITSTDDTEEAEFAVADVCDVTAQAARSAVAMREEEGRRLATDLVNRLQAIEAALQRIERRAPDRLIAERDRMRRVVGELVADIPVDEDRITREVAFMAERLDISEELVRLRSHIELFGISLEQESAEPTGKRLSFLTQEMNRETNTIGSKAADAPIEHEVIAIKDEIERLREQVENIE